MGNLHTSSCLYTLGTNALLIKRKRKKMLFLVRSIVFKSVIQCELKMYIVLQFVVKPLSNILQKRPGDVRGNVLSGKQCGEVFYHFQRLNWKPTLKLCITPCLGKSKSIKAVSKQTGWRFTLITYVTVSGNVMTRYVLTILLLSDEFCLIGLKSQFPIFYINCRLYSYIREHLQRNYFRLYVGL